MKRSLRGRNLRVFGATTPTLVGALIAALSIAALALPPAAQAASKSGVAAAALTTTRGTPPGEDTRVLKIGVDIFQDERIVTDEKGKAQLLFLDGTALTIGPNSDLTLDEFVYDPQAKTGKLAFAATKGVFRLVGGAISKRNPITLKTPTATIGVRGGISFINVAEALRAIFVFGDEMSVTSDGVTKTAQRPGLQINVPAGGGAPSDPAPTTDADVSADLNNMEGSSDDDTGSDVAVSDDDVAGSQVGELGSSAGPGVNGIGADGLGGTGAAGAAESSTNLTNASQDNAQTGTGGGVSAGDASGLSGRYKHGFNTLIGSDDSASPFSTLDQRFSGAAIAGGSFMASLPFSSLRFPVTSTGVTTFDAGADTDSPFGLLQGSVFLSSDNEFLFINAEEVFFPGDLILVHAGVPTPTSAFPTTGWTAYDLVTDFQMGFPEISGSVPPNTSFAPFIPFARNVALSGAPPRAYIGWDTSGDPTASRPFYTSSVIIKGQGTAQDFAGAIIVGKVRDVNSTATSPEAATSPFLRGRMRGASRDTTNLTAFLYEGEAGTSSGSDFKHFYGSTAPNYLLIDSSELDADGVRTDFGIGQSILGGPETFLKPNNPLIGTSPGSSVGMNRTSETLFGYVGGVVETINTAVTFDGARTFVNEFTGVSSMLGDEVFRQVQITKNAATNRLNATFDIETLQGGSVFSTAILPFGEVSDEFRSALVDDNIFAAVEQSDTGALLNGALPTVENFGALVTHDQVKFSGVIPSGVSLCSSCEHFEWGVWGYALDETGGFRHEIPIAFWVAGEVLSASSYANLTGTASYDGAVKAVVIDGAVGSMAPIPNRYVAIGAMNLNFSFSPGSLSIVNGTITNLDQRNYDLAQNGPPNNPATVPEFFLMVTGNSTGAIDATGVNGDGTGVFFGSGLQNGFPKEAAGKVQAIHSGLLNYAFSGVFGLNQSSTGP